MNVRRILQRALSSPASLRFDEFRALVVAFGFQLKRTRGSHAIFGHPSIPELVNIQNAHGAAKAYQVRQFIALTERYNLRIEGDA